MMAQSSSKQLGREQTNRSNTPQKTGGMVKKGGAGGHYDNYQMAAGGNQLGASSKQTTSHPMLAKPSSQKTNFQNQV